MGKIKWLAIKIDIRPDTSLEKTKSKSKSIRSPKNICSSVSMAETLIYCLKHDHCNQSSALRAPAGRFLSKTEA